MREAEMRSLWSRSGVLINWTLMSAATSSKRKTSTERIDSMRRSYRIGNQIRLPKQVLDIGQTTVGTHVNRSISDTTAMQTDVFQLPRGAKRSCRYALMSVSTPKTNVMYPMRNMAVMVSLYLNQLNRIQHTRKREHR